jgi:hypothetical protein
MKWKNLIRILPFSLFLMIMIHSCSGPDKSAPVQDTIMDQPDTVLFWTVDDYNKIKTRVFQDTIKITDPKPVVNGINSLYPGVKLRLLNVSNDTVYAAIDSAYTLTESMGSFGAAEYLSTVVINLTTLENINFVSLEFIPGSHAMPGVYSKENYTNYIEKK